VNQIDSYVGRPDPCTIHEAADALNTGSISSQELCQQLIQRHEEIDDKIHAFLHLEKENILIQAAASDKRRSCGENFSRLDGIPVAVKDNISVRDQVCGCASRLLENYRAAYDATVVKKMEEAGIICFGRTNMDEYAMGSSTENSAYTPTRNPWNIDRVPGLKPTYGRVSRFGLVAFASSLDQIGPITRDVKDAALLLDLIGGHDPKDSTSLHTTYDPIEDSLDSFEIENLRIGVPREFFDVAGLSTEVRQMVEKAISAYQSAGCEIIEVSLPNIRYAVASYYIIATAEASSNLARFDGIRYGNRYRDNADLLETYCMTRELGFGPEVKRRIILGTYVLSSGYYDAYYLRAQKMRTLIRKDLSAALEQCDVLLGPVSPTTAFRSGSVTDPLKMYLSDIYTIPVNLSGICAISIPAGFDSEGLPIGVQLIGAAMQEKSILQAGYWFTQQDPSTLSSSSDGPSTGELI
jgi:aspartyl-tRNA(Asn)/glutamyl-tRNA(Gln) amidotransferase subunit A